jgi:small subunit ribosomal protein S13
VARISGVDLPREKRIEIALTYIFGLGPASAKKIIAAARVNPGKRVKDLTEEDVGRLRSIIEQEYKVEGSKRTEVSLSIKRLMEIGCYRGLRHRKGLPVRGQRTRTNARTRKGPRKGAIVKKKTATKK